MNKHVLDEDLRLNLLDESQSIDDIFDKLLKTKSINDLNKIHDSLDHDVKILELEQSTNLFKVTSEYIRTVENLEKNHKAIQQLQEKLDDVQNNKAKLTDKLDLIEKEVNPLFLSIEERIDKINTKKKMKNVLDAILIDDSNQRMAANDYNAIQEELNSQFKNDDEINDNIDTINNIDNDDNENNKDNNQMVNLVI